mmetsp:Transcript_3965/g.11495  ORF Transcript_3965/g.11495 Transcript_3965/m.11495 type:complete len:134 (+) Transcript_3965:276-677(+)
MLPQYRRLISTFFRNIWKTHTSGSMRAGQAPCAGPEDSVRERAGGDAHAPGDSSQLFGLISVVIVRHPSSLQEAEISFLSRKNELEITRAREMAGIEVRHHSPCSAPSTIAVFQCVFSAPIRPNFFILMVSIP